MSTPNGDTTTQPNPPAPPVTTTEGNGMPPPKDPGKKNAALAEVGRLLSSRILDGHEKQQKDNDAALEEAKERSGKKAEGEEESTPAPKPKRRKKVAPAEDGDEESMSPQDVANVAASAAAAAVRESRKLDEPPKSAPVTPEPVKLILPEEDERHRADYEFLISSNPKKWGDLPKRVVDFHDKEKVYREKWEQENLGRDWNPDDEDHNDFYEKNQPRVPAQELEEAHDLRLIAKTKSEVMGEVRPELDAIRQKETAEKIRPKVQSVANDVRTAIMEGINPEYVKAMGNETELKAVFDNDEDAAKLHQQVTKEYEPIAKTIVELEGGLPWDEKNPLHRMAHMVHHYAEAEILKAKPADQVDGEGRKFMKRAQYEALPANEKANYWTLGESELLTVLTNQAKNDVQKRYEEAIASHESYLRKKGGRSETRRQPPKPAPPSPQRGGGPSLGSGPALGNGGGKGNNGSKRGADIFLESIGLH